MLWEEGVVLSGTLLFVHGTGVRGVSYAGSLRLIGQQVLGHDLGLEVRGCFWGESQGARLQCEGRSIPGYVEAGGSARRITEEDVALWAVLYTDPWYELRVLRAMPVRAVPLGQEPPAVRLRRAVAEYVPSDELAAQLADAGLEGRFGEALDALRAAPEFEAAVKTAPVDPLEHRAAIARALVAHTLVAAAEEGGVPFPDGAVRDAIVLRITDEFHGHGLGVGDFVKRTVVGLAARGATRRLHRDRGALTDAAAPASGDVLRFLANGEGAREYVRRAVTDAAERGPVYLLAHSLGGMICADLLVREPLPAVAALITVGSQTPFLYEIGAFPSLAPPAALPAHFPPWMNLYDPRDMLAYVCGGVFGERVRDVAVDNGQPFPWSHTSYWSNRDVWRAVAKAVGC